ncbi:PepSY domain-containing protein [Aromatoleum petrolei]|uniref:PepSY domain-containing protein n=1 Tax=Aromatoleum petrolei TaxID=76116 RepID=A0ABX1MQM8_9RHOO|nr:PepSY domain-containing protein [Aromatoleum petrolei]NMF90262.1 PepSY domain-containing protein [Aromatoleum petrolei]QTQ35534.1 PepSY domain-containing protein [Aromatoleum petrolei]
MRTNKSIVTLTLSASLLAGGVIASAFAAGNSAGTGGAQWLTPHEVQLKVEALGYRDLTKLERENDKYEIKAKNADGRLVKIDVDPVTGAVLKTEVKRDKDIRSGATTGLTLHQAQVKVEAMGYRDIQEIERDGDKFEVTATDREGRLVELDVAPLTGEVLDTEVKRNN